MNNDRNDRNSRTEIVSATPNAPASLVLAGISKAAADPNIDVEKLERLLAIQERLLADQRRAAFSAALARLQARMPQIVKNGSIDRGQGKTKTTYARIEDIDAEIRPLMADEGFAVAYDSKSVPGGIEFTCAMSHREGHTETKTLTLPIDNGPGRNAVQSIGSTTTYAKRYLLGMHLNLITCDEDDDGQGGGDSRNWDRGRETGARDQAPSTDHLAAIAAANTDAELRAVVDVLKKELAEGKITGAQANSLSKVAKARRDVLTTKVETSATPAGESKQEPPPAGADDGP